MVARLSPRGVALCVKYFIERGHQVTTFLPNYNSARNDVFVDRKCEDPHKIIDMLFDLGILTYTPTRHIYDPRTRGHRIIPNYDDL